MLRTEGRVSERAKAASRTIARLTDELFHEPAVELCAEEVVYELLLRRLARAAGLVLEDDVVVPASLDAERG